MILVVLEWDLDLRVRDGERVPVSPMVASISTLSCGFSDAAAAKSGTVSVSSYSKWLTSWIPRRSYNHCPHESACSCVPPELSCEILALLPFASRPVLLVFYSGTAEGESNNWPLTSHHEDIEPSTARLYPIFLHRLHHLQRADGPPSPQTAYIPPKSSPRTPRSSALAAQWDNCFKSP